jgi:alpha/beta superfamily hydrolase
LKQLHITFPCGELSLEGVWHLPEAAGPFPVVIVCHPHPLYGGDMTNNVVLVICEALAAQSIAALRFNFRGVGMSDGIFGGGIGEQEDVKAAITFALSTPGIDTSKIGLAGYSFGARVVLPVAVQDDRINHLALVSPALSEDNWEQLKGYRKAKFLIRGDVDAIIPVELWQNNISTIPEPREDYVVPGVDHFWWEHETELAWRVSGFFASGFRPVNAR